jgi:hypothetical protein
MPIRGNYLDMALSIDDLDGENVEYFRHCAEHDFHLQQCDDCKLPRYPPTTAYPWCTCLTLDLGTGGGEGRGALYEEVHRGIQLRSRRVPYMVLLVELDTQKAKPTEFEALRCRQSRPRMAFAPPDMVKRVGIGSRMRMVFSDVGPAFRCRNGRSMRRATTGQAVALSTRIAMTACAGLFLVS